MTALNVAPNSTLNATHDPARRSWLPSANNPASDFPIQNLPFGIFHTSANPIPRAGIAIGDSILDIPSATAALLFTAEAAIAAQACLTPPLNSLMALGPRFASALRARVADLLDAALPHRAAVEPHLVPQSAATMHLPAAIGNYTDFYASIHHATRVGAMFRPDNPLLPNYKYVPIGYHGRASSIVIDSTPVRRPSGQLSPTPQGPPTIAPSRLLDYELELAAFAGPGNALGTPIPIAQADDHIFGLVLLNDWSARDIQSWEYQPLGPFLSKNFSTSISPWIVTLEALAPYRVSVAPRPLEDPAPLPYLTSENDQQHGALDLTLEVFILTDSMRRNHSAPHRLSRGNFRDMYWTLAQLFTHHASNGCNLRPGDLLASGTVSGPELSTAGCLLELTARGKNPIALPNGESRAFLNDDDEIILRGFCHRDGLPRIGFGSCSGRILPALP
jgi:fumarylacetoacetase